MRNTHASHIALSGLLAFLVLSCSPRQYHVNFNGRPTDDDWRGRGLGQLYSLQSAEAKNSLFYQNLVFPENLEARDTAIMLVHFPGVPGSMNGICFLVTNYKSARYRVYPDRNNNLDFSDDGPPIHSNPQDSSLAVYLSRANDSAAMVGVKLKKFRDNKRSSELGKDFQRHYFIPEEIPILPARYWFWETRLNTRQAKIELQGDSVRIGIQDSDFDGYLKNNAFNSFNLAREGSYLGFYQRDGAVDLQDSALFNYKDQVYRITQWDSLGGFVEFTETDESYQLPLKAGNPIPDVKVKTLNQQDTSLFALIDKKPYTLFYLWGSWCGGCHQGAQKLKAAADAYRDKLQVIGLNSGEPKFGLEAFIEKYHHTWPQYYVSPDFKKTFLVEGFPDYILVNSEGKLISYRARPQNLEKLLQK